MREVAIRVTVGGRSARRPGRSSTSSHGMSFVTSRANIAHGVWPPLTATVNRPLIGDGCIRPLGDELRPPARLRHRGRHETSSASATAAGPSSRRARRTPGASPRAACRRTVQPPRSEARVQRGRQRGGGDADLDRGDRRPPALARVGDPALVVVQRRGRVQRLGGQIEQPRSDDAAAAPDLGHVGRVDVIAVVLRILERRVSASMSCWCRPASAFLMMFRPSAYAAIRPYSMPLWTIFTKWPAPFGPQWRKPFSAGVGSPVRPGGVRSAEPTPGAIEAKIGLEPIDHFLLPADHQAEAAVDSPHAAARPSRRRGGCPCP